MDTPPFNRDSARIEANGAAQCEELAGWPHPVLFAQGRSNERQALRWVQRRVPIDSPTSFTVIADLRHFAPADPPNTGFFVPIGLHCAMQAYGASAMNSAADQRVPALRQ
jgi:hypothetical protein